MFARTEYKRLFSRAFRYNLNPTVSELCSAAEVKTVTPRDIILHIDESLDSPLVNIEQEYEILLQEIKSRIENTELVFPVVYAAGNLSIFLIYALLRLMKPECVVETGIANGYSSFFILNALKKNKRGRLYSFDVSPRSGILLQDEEKHRWNQIILRGNYREKMEDVISKIPHVDLFIHDSDHSYRWQQFEYDLITTKLKKNSVLLSDDIDTSFAFLDYCQNRKKRPHVLIEPFKVFGALFDRDALKEKLDISDIV